VPNPTQELQQRNAQLLATVRALTADNEAHERVGKGDAVPQDSGRFIEVRVCGERVGELVSYHVHCRGRVRAQESKRELADLQQWRRQQAAAYASLATLLLCTYFLLTMGECAQH
jgi:hypothetical protein